MQVMLLNFYLSAILNFNYLDRWNSGRRMSGSRDSRRFSRDGNSHHTTKLFNYMIL